MDYKNGIGAVPYGKKGAFVKKRRRVMNRLASVGSPLSHQCKCLKVQQIICIRNARNYPFPQENLMQALTNANQQ